MGEKTVVGVECEVWVYDSARREYYDHLFIEKKKKIKPTHVEEIGYALNVAYPYSATLIVRVNKVEYEDGSIWQRPDSEDK